MVMGRIRFIERLFCTAQISPSVSHFNFLYLLSPPLPLPPPPLLQLSKYEVPVSIPPLPLPFLVVISTGLLRLITRQSRPTTATMMSSSRSTGVQCWGTYWWWPR